MNSFDLTRQHSFIHDVSASLVTKKSATRKVFKPSSILDDYLHKKYSGTKIVKKACFDKFVTKDFLFYALPVELNPYVNCRYCCFFCHNRVGLSGLET